jgi:hypothetical protein
VAIVTGENPKQYAVNVLYRMLADTPPQGEKVTCWTAPDVPEQIVAGTFLRLTSTSGKQFCIAWEYVQTVTWELV